MLELLEDEGHGLAFGIQVTDVSSGGLGITSGGALYPGQQVRLYLNGGILLGKVAHCHPGNGRFAAGITVDHDSGILSAIQWIACLRPSAHEPSRNSAAPAGRLY